MRPRLVATALLLGAAAPAAIGAPSFSDRIGSASPGASAVSQSRDRLAGSRVVLNAGAYAIVEARSAVSTSHEHAVRAKCPAGMKAMSAGFAAPSGRGEPPDFRVIFSQPDDDGSGWAVFGVFDGSGGVDAAGVSNAPMPYEWRLRVRLVCARL